MEPCSVVTDAGPGVAALPMVSMESPRDWLWQSLTLELGLESRGVRKAGNRRLDGGVTRKVRVALPSRDTFRHYEERSNPAISIRGR